MNAIQVDGLCYQPHGSNVQLLDDVCLQLPPRSLGLIFGRSGSGKTTLLQILSGLTTPTAGTVRLVDHSLQDQQLSPQEQQLLQQQRQLQQWQKQQGMKLGSAAAAATAVAAAAAVAVVASPALGPIAGAAAAGIAAAGVTAAGAAAVGASKVNEEGSESGREEVASAAVAGMKEVGRAELADRAGIVFQFPERYFLSDTVLGELTFGWPRRMEDIPLRQMLAMRVQAAVMAVGLLGIPLDTNPRALSGGNQRRLALAIQLVRMPEILLLDEPLAGLDWKARADVVKLLADLKRERSILVVSHDLRELSPLVDVSWRMQMGGRLREEELPDMLSDEE